MDEHDYQFKKKHIERFLADGDKVKATIFFRGREMAHPEIGRRILERLCDELAILDRGRVIARGAPRGLIGRHIEPQVVEVYGEGAPAWAAGDAPPHPDELCRALLQAGFSEAPPRDDVATQIAATNHATVVAHHVAIANTLAAIAADRDAAYARAGITSSR